MKKAIKNITAILKINIKFKWTKNCNLKIYLAHIFILFIKINVFTNYI